ncbi:MAG: sigma-70 family RNA polymerase sigma factor [Gemmatimonadota bacterium]|nr:sigma-70 family RNA polymerase sigma factor [Gemmatimonadota bacterium]
MKSASARRRKPTPTKSKPATGKRASAKAKTAKAATPKAGKARVTVSKATASKASPKAASKTTAKATASRPSTLAAAKAGNGKAPAKATKATNKASTKAASGNGRTPAAASTPASTKKAAPNTVSVTTEPKARRRRRSAPAGIAPSEPERDILDQYLYEVSTYPLLKGHEEIDIARKIRAGDADALQELVKRNLRFVISVAKKYQNRGLPLIDLIGEGNVGLLTAARKFDPDQGVKFISYAVWWIRQAILSSLARQGRTVRVPLNRTADLSRIIKASEILRQKLRREPTPEELSQLTGLSVDVVQSLAALNTGDVRLDAPMDPDGDRSLIERFVADEMPDTEEEAMNRFLNDEVEAALNTLPPRDAKVLRLYFGLEGGREHTLEEIGSMLGVTRERVRQLRDRALKRLREGEVGRALGSFAA